MDARLRVFVNDNQLSDTQLPNIGTHEEYAIDALSSYLYLRGAKVETGAGKKKKLKIRRWGLNYLTQSPLNGHLLGSEEYSFAGNSLSFSSFHTEFMNTTFSTVTEPTEGWLGCEVSLILNYDEHSNPETYTATIIQNGISQTPITFDANDTAELRLYLYIS